ncbi:TBC1 domain family member 7 [Sitophilus oryzae]|uniref:TBC1 domain family member 7 n=1 Tax=Sitophilus oryzae TaxID=7048 RepID=A0A6J2YDQ9_SITOR|nr:TBC1 domain family member 7 [Sitophilus oryzae]
MGTDERNFRSVYYEKVGFKSVEEKKSIEMLLKEKPIDQVKLKQFCLRFTVPHIYRALVWKLLLGIIPMHIKCHKFVMEQRKQEYDDLYHTLHVIKNFNEKTPKQQIFLYMWLIQTRKLTFNINLEQNSDAESFTAIIEYLLYVIEDDVDLYWIGIKIYDKISKHQEEIPKLIECTHNLIEKEDPDLYRYLVQNNLLESIPLKKWFNCWFAGILNENCLARIWDKTCGGSYKILAFLVPIILTTLRHKIMKTTDIQAVIDNIKNIPEDTTDSIINKSIDKWQHHGSPLTVQDKPKTN